MSDNMIVRNPQILAGKPTIRGTRISVELIIGLLASGWSETDILDSYPHITRDGIAACLRYARDAVVAQAISPAA